MATQDGNGSGRQPRTTLGTPARPTLGEPLQEVPEYDELEYEPGYDEPEYDEPEYDEPEYDEPEYEEPPCVPLGGRAVAGMAGSAKAIKVQAQPGNVGGAFAPNANPDLIDTELIVTKASASSIDGNPRLWLIRTTVDEQYHNIAANFQDPTGLHTPGGVAQTPTWTGRSLYHVKCRLGSHGRGDTFCFDLGAPPIEVWAQTIDLSLVTADALTVEYINPPSAFDGALQNQVCTSAGLEIIPIEASVGRRRTIMTRVVGQAANTALGVEIPRYTRLVTIYQAAYGLASVNWTFRIGSLAVSHPAGTIPWLVGGRRTEAENIVPGASLIQADIDVANDRLFMCVFELEV